MPRRAYWQWESSSGAPARGSAQPEANVRVRWTFPGLTITTNLPDHLARFAEAEVAAGRFASIESVLEAGVEALRKRQERYDAKMSKLREAIAKGDASPDFEGNPFASVRAELGLPQLLSEMKAENGPATAKEEAWARAVLGL